MQRALLKSRRSYVGLFWTTLWPRDWAVTTPSSVLTLLCQPSAGFSCSTLSSMVLVSERKATPGSGQLKEVESQPNLWIDPFRLNDNPGIANWYLMPQLNPGIVCSDDSYPIAKSSKPRVTLLKVARQASGGKPFQICGVTTEKSLFHAIVWSFAISSTQRRTPPTMPVLIT